MRRWTMLVVALMLVMTVGSSAYAQTPGGSSDTMGKDKMMDKGKMGDKMGDTMGKDKMMDKDKMGDAMGKDKMMDKDKMGDTMGKDKMMDKKQ